MGLLYEEPYTYGFNKIDLETLKMEDSTSEANSSEQDNLLHRPSFRVRSTQSLRYHLTTTPINCLFSAGFIIIIGLLVSLLVMVHTQAATLDHTPQHQHVNAHSHTKEHYSNTGSSNTSSEALSPTGLRLSIHGLLLECGATQEEAIANGCIFDIMSFVYVPPGCFEPAIYAETLSLKSPLAPEAAGFFPWFRWANFTEPIPQDENELSNYRSVWTTQGWHVAHCLYTWRVSTRALARVAAGEEGVYVVEEATSPTHVDHCNMLVLDHDTSSMTPLRAYRSIEKCVRLDG